MTEQAGKNSRKLRNAPSAGKPAPSLTALFYELQRKQNAFAMSSSARFTGAVSSGFALGSGSFASGGSCGRGYGLGLIAADEESQRRIKAIMHDLCAKDAAKAKK